MRRHSSRRTVVSMMALALMALAGLARAADGGTIQGVVKDASGSPVAGAFVKLHNAERRLVFMVISQPQGRYTAADLPPGKWAVQGVGGDRQSDMSSPVDLAAGGKATVNVSLTAQRAPDLPHAWPGRPPGQEGGEADSGAKKISLPDGPGKRIALTKCSVCHDAERIATTPANQQRWQEIIEEMRAYMQGSSQAKDLTDQEANTLLDYVVTNFTGTEPHEMPRRSPTPTAACPER